MFPFVLSFSGDYSCEELTSELKAKFKAGRWYLKQNTSFTQLSNCNIERSTFQIVGRSDARRQRTFPPCLHFPFAEKTYTARDVWSQTKFLCMFPNFLGATRNISWSFEEAAEM
jgi:hypothetical protein